MLSSYKLIDICFKNLMNSLNWELKMCSSPINFMQEMNTFLFF